MRRTGFAGGAPETGHAVVAALREQGYHPTVAAVAGHLAAVPTEYNWQGNARIAILVGRSERTVQRARLTLETDALITSYLLLTGDLLEGQRAPVRRPQVIRDVSRLQALAAPERRAARPLAPPHQRTRNRRPSAAEVPTPAPAPERASADELEQLARDKPEFAGFFTALAAARRNEEQRERDTPDDDPPSHASTPDKDAEWDRVTLELALELRRGRGPPDTS